MGEAFVENGRPIYANNEFVLHVSLPRSFLSRGLTDDETRTEESSSECSICLGRLEGQAIAMLLNCRHEFCFSCLLILLATNSVSIFFVVFFSICLWFKKINVFFVLMFFLEPTVWYGSKAYLLV